MLKFYSNLVLLLFVSLMFVNCKETPAKTNYFDHISDEKAKEIIEKSIERHGGLDRWEKLERLDYTKNFALFKSDGSQESFTKQKHKYSFMLGEFLIKSESKNKTTQLLKNIGGYSKKVDGLEAEESLDKLKKSFNTSMYVVSMPFKLLDEGVNLSYEGLETGNDGRETHIIKAVYNTGENKNHSTDDIWWYYFDKEDYKIVANKVITSDHSAIVDNLSFIEKGGILFNGHRKSYRLDSLGNKDYLRAEYFYDNYEVK